MTWTISKAIMGTLMSGILVLGSISAILVTIILSGGILGDYDISAQALPSDGTVKDEQKISDTSGNFNGGLIDSDRFGESLANIGDLNEDGVTDLAVGAVRDDDGGTDRGAIWILFMNSDGTVKSEQKISNTEGNFAGVLDDVDLFGTSPANIGDLNEDGVTDIATGALFDDDGGTDRGAVWILFMNSDGTVKDEQKISDTEGGFDGVLADSDFFGRSVASLGDLNEDGVTDLAVGANGDDDGGSIRGAVWILFMNSDGTVKDEQKISDLEGGFDGVLADGDNLGRSVASLGNLDESDGADLVVGAAGDEDGGPDRGAIWILFMNSDGTVKSEQKISDTEGGFDGVLADVDRFGSSVASMGDLNEDGIKDIAVGAQNDDDGGFDKGATWILFMNSDGTVKSEQKISDTEGGFDGVLSDRDFFGASVASIGDLNDDGVMDLAVGANADEDGGPDRGAIWILFLDEIRKGKLKCHKETPTIVGTEGNDFLVGTAGVDVIHGLGGNDTIMGFGENDIMCGGDGDDKIFGGDGNDTAIGGKGNDFISLGKGNDKAFGNEGNDQIFGGPGDDNLGGGIGDDNLFGQDGDDNLNGSFGTDRLDGGANKDICVSGNIILACENIVFVANLEGVQEVPPVDTDASGVANFGFNATGNELLKFRISIENLDLDGNQTGDVNDDVVAAHIHLAPSGVNGPVVVGFISPETVDNFQLDPVAGVISGIITSDSLINDLAGQELSALIAEMTSGNTYVNIHTVGNPGGEIRGQI